MLNEVSFVVFRFFVEYICNHDDGACERMTDLSQGDDDPSGGNHFFMKTVASNTKDLL